jgi:hypothetical protein
MMESMKAAQPNRPIALHPETIAKCDGPNQFENFDRAFRSVIAVPKAAVERAEAKWSKARKKRAASKS